MTGIFRSEMVLKKWILSKDNLYYIFLISFSQQLGRAVQEKKVIGFKRRKKNWHMNFLEKN